MLPQEGVVNLAQSVQEHNPPHALRSHCAMFLLDGTYQTSLELEGFGGQYPHLQEELVKET